MDDEVTLPLTTTVEPAVEGITKTVAFAVVAVQTPLMQLKSPVGLLPIAHSMGDGSVGGSMTALLHTREQLEYNSGQLQAASVSFSQHVDGVRGVVREDSFQDAEQKSTVVLLKSIARDLEGKDVGIAPENCVPEA